MAVLMVHPIGATDDADAAAATAAADVATTTTAATTATASTSAIIKAFNEYPQSPAITKIRATGDDVIAGLKGWFEAYAQPVQRRAASTSSSTMYTPGLRQDVGRRSAVVVVALTIT